MPIESAKELLAEVRRVRDEVTAQAAEIRKAWEPRLHRGAFRPSAENLADYLAFRRIDLRPIEAMLAPWGLASLGRCEGRVMPSLKAIIANLELICRTNAETPRPDPADFRRDAETLARNTTAVLGPASKGRRTRILVTLSPQAAEDEDHVGELINAGMDCARVNCAHGAPSEWAAMVANVKTAARKHGREIRVLVDLAGPKVRTEDVVTPKKRKRVEAGDRILLTFGAPTGNKEFAYQASCTAPDVLRQVPVGADVSIKDAAGSRPCARRDW